MPEMIKTSTIPGSQGIPGTQTGEAMGLLTGNFPKMQDLGMTESIVIWCEECETVKGAASTAVMEQVTSELDWLQKKYGDSAIRDWVSYYDKKT